MRGKERPDGSGRRMEQEEDKEGISGWRDAYQRVMGWMAITIVQEKGRCRCRPDDGLYGDPTTRYQPFLQRLLFYTRLYLLRRSLTKLRPIHWVGRPAGGVLVSRMALRVCCLARSILWLFCETRSALWRVEIRQGNAKRLHRVARRSI